MHKKLRFSLLAIVVTAIVSAIAYIPVSAKGNRFEKFYQLSDEVNQLNTEYFTGQGEERVEFEMQRAKKDGFSNESLQIASEMERYTNDLIRQAKLQPEMDRADVRKLKVSTKSYPHLERYFKQATEAATESAEIAKATSYAQNKAYICGTWSHPVPSDGVHNRQENRFGPYQFPWYAEWQLQGWGYHAPPWWLDRSGWTRDETYQPVYCGYRTFRDNAAIQEEGGSFYIYEQNYTGYVPGEPSPEVWRSGPWPYSTWPSYVNWWHANF